MQTFLSPSLCHFYGQKFKNLKLITNQIRKLKPIFLNIIIMSKQKLLGHNYYKKPLSDKIDFNWFYNNFVQAIFAWT